MQISKEMVSSMTTGKERFTDRPRDVFMRVGMRRMEMRVSLLN